jgi:hypothetical protein
MNCEFNLNIDNSEWSVAVSGEGSWIDLFIGFSSNQEVTVFDNLSFYYEISINNDSFDKKIYPPEGVSYVQTDQPYIVTDRVVGIRPDDVLSLTVHARNANIDYEETVMIMIPRPPQPESDCVWDDAAKAWDCPEVIEDGE